MARRTKLQPGDAAPQFIVKDTTGRTIRLSDYQKGYTLIAFLRYSGCPWCNLAVHRLAMEHPLLADSDCKILAFIQSSEQNIKSNIFDRHSVQPLFPIVADSSMQTYGKYTVQPNIIDGVSYHIKHIPSWVRSVSKEGFKQESVDGNLFLAPAVFLVSPRDQILLRADYSADLYKHESFTDIYDTITNHSLYGSEPNLIR
ncbi:MAG: redoxin domain-containing protein [Chloroflexi bacterium]|nr:MAG: redoxin domain-containing protein [Chloroflexota bacterium]